MGGGGARDRPIKMLISITHSMPPGLMMILYNCTNLKPIPQKTTTVKTRILFPLVLVLVLVLMPCESFLLYCVVTFLPTFQNGGRSEKIPISPMGKYLRGSLPLRHVPCYEQMIYPCTSMYLRCAACVSAFQTGILIHHVYSLGEER